jgi:hypothetical protein
MVNLDDILYLVQALVAGLDIDIDTEISKRLVSQAGSGDRILIKTGNTISTNSYTKDRIVQYPLDLEFVTQEDLDTAIDQIIEKIDEFKVSRGIAGLTKTYSIQEYTDDISRNAEDESEILSGTTARLEETPSAFPDDWYILVRFINEGIPIKQGLQLVSGSLRITPSTSRGDNMHNLTITGYKGGNIPDPTTTLIGVWDNGDTTKVFADELGGLPAINWDKDEEITLTVSDGDSILEVLQEIIDDAGFDGDFGMALTVGSEDENPYFAYAFNSSNSNPDKYMEIDIVYNYANEDIFNIRLISAPSSKIGDKFKAQIVLEINQSVT